MILVKERFVSIALTTTVSKTVGSHLKKIWALHVASKNVLETNSQCLTK